MNSHNNHENRARYTTPELDIVRFSCHDVLTTSGEVYTSAITKSLTDNFKNMGTFDNVDQWNWE